MTDNVLRTADELGERLEQGKLDGCLVTDVDLSSVGLPEATVSDVTLRRVGLHGADISAGDFSRVKFTESSCRSAKFSGGRFRGCSFFGSELIEAGFEGGLLNGTSFYTTRMGNADFSGSRLQGCTFNSCELFGVKFNRSLLINTKFEAQDRGNVTLDRADFSNAVLIDCDLLGSNLFGANFENALLIKVDLRHANLSQANFKGAKLVDVQMSMAQLEPSEKRQLEAARVDDPWRQQGFMKDVLSAYSGEELSLIMELLMRTYVIEGAKPTTTGDSFAGILANLKATYDFPELEHLRVHGSNVQVRNGHQWTDLGVSGIAQPLVAEPVAPPASPAQESSAPTRNQDSTNEPNDQRPKPKAAPRNVKKSKRFRKLELD